MNISEKIQLLTQDASVVETAKANIKQAIIDKGVSLTGVPFTSYHTKIAEISGGGSGGVTPTDDKTHVFVRLTVASGKNLSLYLNKTDTSTLSIDWGDNITTTHTNNGNFNTSHTYSDYGDYEIKIWISSGLGLYSFGNGDSSTVFVGGVQQKQRDMLMSLFVGNNVSSTGTYAFQYCHSLTNIVIPESVSSIEIYAFRQCYALTSISIPESVSSIGSSAFYNCYSILKYVFNRSLPPSLAYTSAFTNINGIAKIYVPDASVTAYKNATNWNTYDDYIYPISEMESD